FAADVGDDLVAVGQAHLGDLTQGGVRLLRGGGVDTGADAATLGAVFQRRALAALATDLARFAQQLSNGRHDLYASFVLAYVYVDIQNARACLAARGRRGAFSGDVRKIRLKRMT